MIDIEFPKEKYLKLFETLSLKEDQILNIDQIKQIFLLSIEFFEDGFFSLDDLSSISGTLWDTFHKLSNSRQVEYNKLGELLYSADELSYETRNPHTNGSLSKTIEELLNYLKESE